MSGISKDLQIWIEARNRFHLSHSHVQMARELGMNPKKLGKVANHKQEPWKLPLPQFIEHLYQRRFGKNRPDVVVPIEERARQLEAKKSARREVRRRMEDQARGIAWFAPEQWDQLLEISADRDFLEDSYEKWLAKAENARVRTGASGAITERVTVVVDELETWCRARGWVINEKSRLRFVAYLMRRRKGECQKGSDIGGRTHSEDLGTVLF